MRALPRAFTPYEWAPSTEEIARLAGIAPADVLRFDGNTAPRPLPTSTTDALAGEVVRINAYPHGGYRKILPAIAEYAGVEPENVVLGAGADDLIMLCARSFAGPGDRVAIADEPTYPVFRVATWIAGAEVAAEGASLTFCCRPHNPTGALVELPAARPLVVDEAYFEYSGVSAVGLLEDDVIVLRTFSKAFGLAGARIGYALASREIARELNTRQSPAPVSTLSVALAVAGLAEPPDVSPVVEERARLADRLRTLGLEPLPSHTNFLYVPVVAADQLAARLLERGLAVRPFGDAIRITVRDAEDDDVLVEAIARELP